MQSLEYPVNKEQKMSITVSLRGSLAAEFTQVVEVGGDGEAYIRSLTRTSDSRFEKFFFEGMLIIGLVEERGMFLPDW